MEWKEGMEWNGWNGWRNGLEWKEWNEMDGMEGMEWNGRKWRGRFVLLAAGGDAFPYARVQLYQRLAIDITIAAMRGTTTLLQRYLRRVRRISRW